MFEVVYFLSVLCIFDYHNTGQIVKAVDEHSPDHGHTAMANWKLLFPKGETFRCCSSPDQSMPRDRRETVLRKYVDCPAWVSYPVH